MMRRIYLIALVAGAALAGSAFLPWLRLGEVGLAGVPDPAGFFVLGLGVTGLLLAAAGIFARRDTRQGLVLVGLAGLTTLAVVWWTGPSTVADRAQARAEAIALVDSVAAPAVPPVTVGAGLIVGLIGSAVIAGAGLTGVRAE